MEWKVIAALFRAHNDGDEGAFASLGEQVVASEFAAKHFAAAAGLRAALEYRPQTPNRMWRLAEMAKPHAPPFVRTTASTTSLGDLVLRPGTRDTLLGFLREHERRADLEAVGLHPSRRLLFHGPPGNGKTKAAESLAAALCLPLHYVAIGGLVDSYLGGTNANLIAAFRYAAAHPGLLFFDEFDALCGGRGGGDDLREMHRVVNGFLQSFDRDCQDTIVVAATNVPGAIDGAVWRRFDLAIEFPVPDRAMVHEYVQRRAATFPVDPPSGGDADYVSAAVAQVSMAGLERAVTRAMRGAVLGGVRLVTADALRAAVALCADRRIGREQVPVTPPRDT